MSSHGCYVWRRQFSRRASTGSALGVASLTGWSAAPPAAAVGG